MYLFLRSSRTTSGRIRSFTFHNVSISTKNGFQLCVGLVPLHSTMYLFLLCLMKYSWSLTVLYIPQCIYFYMNCQDYGIQTLCFTFHNVSISTLRLFRSVTNSLCFTFHNVSISTGGTTTPPLVVVFTFHNVSISTSYTVSSVGWSGLYIPQCIYFYNETFNYVVKRWILYIPQCIYFYLGWYY